MVKTTSIDSNVQTSIKTSLENHEASERSRNSVIQGNRIFVWDHEEPRTDEPYVDHKYHIPFNPPPNEVNFIGGLGKKRGNLRSKVHPNRPTLVQKIYNMRNENRIDVSFTKPLQETNCCVHRQLTKVDLVKTFTTTALRSIVQKISFADIVETSSNSSVGSDVSGNVLLARKMQRKKLQYLKRENEDQNSRAERYCINGKPFYIKQSEIQQRAKTKIEKANDKNLLINDVCADSELSFRKWAAEQEQSKMLIRRFAPATKHKTADTDAISDNSSRQSSNVQEHIVKKPRRMQRKFVNKLNYFSRGFMYGAFTKVKSKTPSTKADRFGIPFTMIERAQKQHEKQKIQENVLRRVRLSHMGYRQPPIKDDSSDNESVQNVKRLALLRTPYFLVPTIKISRVRRKERFRNKYLQKDRLNRINLLLYERTKKSPSEFGYGESGGRRRARTDVAEIAKKASAFSKYFQLATKNKVLLKDNPIKDKYFNIIRTNFEEQQRMCEPNTNRVPTFNEFKKHEEDAEIVGQSASLTKEISDKQLNGHKVAKEEAVDRSFLGKLFRRQKNFRFRKQDDVEGPLYIDPHLIDKMEKPNKFKMHCKYYTNLYKSKFGLRNRLQVNDDPFEFGKISIEVDHKNPTLPTEWDDYYVHEMRYRRSVKKFCVKTDILKLRDIVRKDFLMYYAQENLFDLKARQIAENRIMDSAENFGLDCSKQFNGWAEEAYNKLIMNNKRLDELEQKNCELKKQVELLQDDYDKLNKDILLSESEWEFLVKIQNYYYLFMDVEWRNEHDWIHRDANNRLLMPLEGIKFCGERNIRPKVLCSAEAVNDHFERKIKPNFDKIKATQPNAGELKKNLDILLKKVFVALNQSNKTTWMYKDVERMHGELKKKMKTFEAQQQEKITELKKRQETLAERQQWLQINGEKLLNQSLTNAYYNPIEEKILGIVDVLYEQFVPKEQLSKQLIQNTSEAIKFSFIHQFTMDLLNDLDTIPTDILVVCEQRVRKKRKLNELHAKKAVITQNRFEMLSKQIKHQFAPAAAFRRVRVAPSLTRCRQIDGTRLSIPKTILPNEQ